MAVSASLFLPLMKQPYHSGITCIGLMLILAFGLTQCNKSTSYNKFLDPELVKIADFCDQRSTDSVLSYLNHKQPILRIEAAYALASMRDPKAIDALHKTILDPVAEVRAAAAYALGQTLHPSSIQPLSVQLTNEGNSAAVIAMAEALGKIAGGLHASSTAPEFVEDAANALFNYERTDSIGIHAVAKAAFWMHTSGWPDTRLINKLAFVFPTQPVINRRMIAFAMSRYRGEWFNDTIQTARFFQAIELEKDTTTLTASMAVAGRSESVLAANFIIKCLQSSQPSREWTIATCRAAGKHTGVPASAIIPMLEDSRNAVAEEACFALQNKQLRPEEILEIKTRTASSPMTIQAACARMLHQHGDSLNLDTWLNTIEGNLSTYDRLACIRLLGITGKSALLSLERALNNPDILQANAYTEAFIESHSQPGFPAEVSYAQAMLSLLNHGDIGITALCAAELRKNSPATLPENEIKELNQALLATLDKLQLPREVETANEIIKTLNSWGFTPREEIKVAYNHPIDWNLVRSIPRRQRAAIHTSKGILEIELHVEDAPGSVASFVQLCREGFYNGKSFHRVVPSFVIQGGCPRGDGMGGTDYTLRSEFRLHDYSTGSVGLASSGPDTESCQWFITHMPTPHLEGRYTIFAHVTQGMSVVDRIEIGDSIKSIELLEE
jgi:cyclophilin family peptidyl-prolyl cis-trans isomerase/HEAT repeat protein